MEQKKKKEFNRKLPYFSLGVSVLLILLDQLFKYLASSRLRPVGSVSLIPGLLNLTYVENTGAAFGMLEGKRILLSLIVLLVLAGFIYVLLSGRIKDTFLIWTSSLIIAGGAGNLIDRVLYGYVVDYLDIGPLFSFPVFNFADICVVVGCILMVIYLLRSESKKNPTEKKEV